MGALLAGLALGVRFNPLSAAIASGAAAAYAAADGTVRGRRGVASAVLAAGWLIGDGLRVIGRAREVFDGVRPLLAQGAPRSAEWTAVVVWAAVGFALGYVVPAWAGVYAGRQTVRGLPWAVAACVAVGASLGFAAVAGGL